ncbi:Protein of unknown function [Gryllus bimaculatus]|nr:Protein of unknown function [Gryllus bimaculatus]
MPAMDPSTPGTEVNLEDSMAITRKTNMGVMRAVQHFSHGVRYIFTTGNLTITIHTQYKIK